MDLIGVMAAGGQERIAPGPIPGAKVARRAIGNVTVYFVNFVRKKP